MIEWVQVVDEQVRLHVVELQERRTVCVELIECAGIIEIAVVRAEVEVAAAGEGRGAFQVAADAQDDAVYLRANVINRGTYPRDLRRRNGGEEGPCLTIESSVRNTMRRS